MIAGSVAMAVQRLRSAGLSGNITVGFNVVRVLGEQRTSHWHCRFGSPSDRQYLHAMSLDELVAKAEKLFVKGQW